MLDYSLALITPPASEPVTLTEVKRHCNVVATDEDTLLTALIAAARELVESMTSRALITQTWRVRLHTWFADGFQLPRPPLIAVTSIKYFDESETEQTLAANAYLVDTDRQPGVLWWDDETVQPVLDDRPNGVSILYTAGYGAAAAVPNRAKQAILLLVGHWYKNREAVGRAEGEVALTVERLVQSLRLGVYP